MTEDEGREGDTSIALRDAAVRRFVMTRTTRAQREAFAVILSHT